MASSTSTRTSGVSYRRLAQLALMAAAAAALANAVLFFIFQPLGAWPQDVIAAGNQSHELSSYSHLLICGGIRRGGRVFGLLARFTGQPERNFYIVAAVVFIGFFFTPFTIPDAPSVMIVALEIVHVPPALASLIVLPKALKGPHEPHHG